MSDKGIRIRRAQHDADNPYYMVRRDTAQDKTLSYEALGMLNYILSKPDTWIVQPSDLERAGCKRNRVYKLLRELIEANYIERIINKDSRQRVTSVEYITHEKPLVTSPQVELQEMVTPQVETRHITKYREEQNTEKDTASAGTDKAPVPDKWIEAIGGALDTNAEGFVKQVRGMMFGRGKKGTAWAESNFNPPVKEVQEIVDFGIYTRRRAKRDNCKIPSQPATIQRWFYDFRVERDKKVSHLEPIETEEWGVDTFLRKTGDAS